MGWIDRHGVEHLYLGEKKRLYIFERAYKAASMMDGRDLIIANRGINAMVQRLC
jgi:hypothetical protein